jgi:CheY-like chemotaxis protein
MKNILLIDDNEFLLNVMVKWINFHLPDCRILVAFNGRDGLEILKQNSPDLIMTDLHMPVMDGFKFIEKKNGICPDTPVIVMTSDFAEEVISRLKALGVTQCMEKPFKFESLMDRLLEVMHADRNQFEAVPA